MHILTNISIVFATNVHQVKWKTWIWIIHFVHFNFLTCGNRNYSVWITFLAVCILILIKTILVLMAQDVQSFDSNPWNSAGAWFWTFKCIVIRSDEKKNIVWCEDIHQTLPFAGIFEREKKRLIYKAMATRNQQSHILASQMPVSNVLYLLSWRHFKVTVPQIDK